MKTTNHIILICPEQRPAGAIFHRMKPLALMPVLGRPLLEIHLEDLATRGIKQVTVLASDRPELVSEFVENGARWGLDAEVIPTPKELTAAEAHAKHGLGADTEVLVVEGLPGGSPLWQGAGATFEQIVSLFSSHLATRSLTMREVKQGVWISTKASIADGVVLHAPVWIGPQVTVRNGAEIGPRSIIESGSLIDEFATIKESWVGPSTYVGAAVNVTQAFGWGGMILIWTDGSQLAIDDNFVLHDMASKPFHRVSFSERAAALALLLFTAPLVLLAVLRSRMRGQPTFEARKVLGTCGRGVQVLHKLTGLGGPLKRWPELWAVVAGRLALIGNRPLTPHDTTALRGEIGQLWLSVPPGVFSLADAEGADETNVAHGIAHAAWFSARQSLRLRCEILMRCIGRCFFKPTNLLQKT